ncbi:hypothetical protein BR93DRAFT_459602 [Coniochaeta sp. PMI_546]|nr:hypothetical protein BR93DRAFT_459602 [Coniochaeta sp. PMI_546]
MAPHIWHIGGEWRRYSVPPCHRTRRTTSLPAASMVSIAQSNRKRGCTGTHPNPATVQQQTREGGVCERSHASRLVSPAPMCLCACVCVCSTFSRRPAHILPQGNGLSYTLSSQSTLSSLPRLVTSLVPCYHHRSPSAPSRSQFIPPGPEFTHYSNAFCPFTIHGPFWLPFASPAGVYCAAILMRPILYLGQA